MRPGPRLVVMVALAFISGAQSSTNQQQSQSSIRGKLLSKRDESAKYDETSPAAFTSLLSKINPWLSACDLAQPSTAPDLQGSCSAGTLPVAWINEGPGPPQCPLSCQHKYHVNDRYNQNKQNTNKDNKSTNKLNNNNNNFSSKSNNNKNNNGINMDNRLNENRQCLDYLGDNDEYSPSQICKKSSSDIETKLKSIRLRHCCERDVLSALHNEAYGDVRNGGAGCVKRLTDLMEADSLAARITCEFMEILVRYDCGHRYSLIHHCGDCKEMYRRWVCSTFIPYFATRNDIKTDPEPVTLADTDAALSNSNLLNNIDNKAQKMFKQTHSLEGSNEIKRSRRKVRLEQKRIRIRPCLSVCQTVEQKCPYMLPNDRAPAYPTQYAGEPTFLCLDPNIDETGNQLYKSNNGPKECCYDYCKHDVGLCSTSCDTIFISNQTAITLNNPPNNLTLSTFSQTPNLFVKLDDGTLVLNDFSHMPTGNMTCPALANITQSTQQCSISQALAASSAASLLSRRSSSVMSLISVLMQQLITTLATYLHLLFPIDFIVASLTSSRMILVWNFVTFAALRQILLQLATGL